MTFEPRHENKNCSACANDQHKHLTYDMWHATCTAILPKLALVGYAYKHATSDFWVYTWKQKLFSLSQGSTFDTWHLWYLTLDTWHLTYMPLLSIDKKTKVVQPVPRIIFNVFKVFKFSDFQVFKVFRFNTYFSVPNYHWIE